MNRPRNERRSASSTRRGRRAASAMMAIGLCSAVASGACLRTGEISAVRGRVRTLEQKAAAVQVELERRIDTGGGDVNEPVTGWILAAGYASIPAAFVVYLIAHRSRRFRAVKDRLRGLRQG